MLKATLAPALLLALISAANADDLCSAVLDQKAFDIYDSATQVHLAQAAKRDICDVHWSSKDDFVNRTRKWDSSFSYIDIFKGTGNADLSSSGHTIDQDYHLLCESTDNSYLIDYLTSSHTQIASFAVAAWEQCIKTTTETGVWSRLDLASDRSSFSIEVRFKPGPSNDKLRILGYAHDAGYSCKYGDQDAKDLTPADLGGGNEFTLQCTPTSNSEIQVSLLTSHKAIGPYTIPPKLSFDPVAEIDKLKQSVATLQQRVTTDDQAILALQGAGISVRTMDDVPAAQLPKSPNWGANGDCDTGAVLLQYYCQVDNGSGVIQNFGASGASSGFHCLWTNTAGNQDGPFRAHGHAICMQTRLVN